MKRDQPLVSIEVKLINNTEKAVLVETVDEEEVWLPFSQIDVTSFNNMFDEDNDLRKGKSINIKVAEWLAKEKGIE